LKRPYRERRHIAMRIGVGIGIGIFIRRTRNGQFQKPPPDPEDFRIIAKLLDLIVGTCGKIKP
jgi:hypothetical protein